MKNKLALFLALALAAVTTSGCAAFDKIFKKDTKEPEQQEAEKEGEKEQEGQPVKPVKAYYNVNFAANGGSGEMESDRTHGSEYFTPVCDFTFEGHTFSKWSLNAVNGDKYGENEKITGIEDDITLYALWVQNPFTVTFDANGGSGTMESQLTNGSTFVAPSCSFTYTNHKFAGWTLNSKYGTHYDVGELIQNIKADITLFAYWQEDTTPVTNYTVTFNANGGTGTMANQQTNGSEFVVPSCLFTKENYDFKNWAYDSVSGTEYSPGSVIKNINKNITLFALWEEKSGTDTGAGTYYDSIGSTNGLPLLGKLHDLSVTNHTNYNVYSGNSTTNCMKTDPYDSTYIRDFYSGAPTKNQVTSSGTVGWNREHVWCQSLSNGLFGTSGAGADIQHIRPTIPTLNSDRGNKKYGELNNSGTLSTATDALGNTVKGGYYSGEVFQPMDDKKGDAARIILYLYMHYNKAANVGGETDGSNPGYFGTLRFTDVMEANNESAAIQLLITWNESDPIDDIEILRNNEATKITGCRNPFIDHPEYARKIWGTNN